MTPLQLLGNIHKKRFLLFTNSIEEIIIDVRTLFLVYFPIIVKGTTLPMILILYFTQCIVI